MDIDGNLEAPAPGAVETAEHGGSGGGEPELELFKQLEDILEALANNPYDYGRHQEHLALARQLGPDAVYGARDMLASYFPLSSEQWLEWITECQTQPQTTEVIEQTLALFQKSLKDLLSVPVCRAYAIYALKSYYHCRGLFAPGVETNPQEDDEEEEQQAGKAQQTPQPDDTLQEIWTVDFTRAHLSMAAERATQHIMEGIAVWELWRDFEMDLLKQAPSAEQVMRIKDMYLNRLQWPHKGMDQTFSAYSTFVTTYMASSETAYEEELMAANAIYGPAKTLWDFRETKELELAAAGFTAEAYIQYATWERTGKKAAQLNPLHARNLYERAVAAHRSDYSVWEAYQDFWRDLVWASSSEHDDDLSEEEMLAALLAVAERSTRHVPFVGESWAALMRTQELVGEHSLVEPTFQRAVDSKLFSNNVDSVVKVYLARADFQRRLFETIVTAEDPVDPPEYLVEMKTVITEGSKAVKRAAKNGDPQMRLEKYLTAFCERFGQLDEAEPVWKNAVGMFKGNVLAWQGYAELQIRRGDLDGARSVFDRALKVRFDYPEYIFEDYLAFEHQHGSVEDYERADRQVRRQLKGVMKHRAQMARAQAGEARKEIETQAAQPAEGAPPGTAETSVSSKATKRPAEDDQAAEPDSKRSKTEHEPTAPEQPDAAPSQPVASNSTAPIKRDRENTTVIVGGLPPSAGEDDLKRLFGDCGEIREVTVFAKPEQTYATVEFFSRDAVLAGLTKDKKQIQGSELTVEKVWQATLYVTNFPESVDDAEMKKFFEPYGTILDVRWPNKRFKSTRRFCYVQFASALSAQRSLELHGRELQPGMRLSVLVSDPERKKERTDVNKNAKEVHVSQLAKSVTEDDLKKLFAPCGSITGVRIARDDATGQSRGYAFVDFQTEDGARQALGLNNQELKKRHISVVIADSRQAGTKARSKQLETTAQSREDQKARSIRVSGLPDNTQDAVLQQFFNKQGKVTKTIVNAERHTATVEFENVAIVGQILLLPQGTLEFEGATLTVQPMAGAAPASTAAAAASGSGSEKPTETAKGQNGEGASGNQYMMAPRTVRGRGGRGRARGRAGFSRS